MSIFDFFKKIKYWEAYKNFLVTECRIPFNVLLTLEDRCNKAAEQVESNGNVDIVDIDEDELMLLQMGIAAKLADKKHLVTLIANTPANVALQTEALNQWQPEKGKIGVNAELEHKKKALRIGVALFGMEDAHKALADIFVRNS